MRTSVLIAVAGAVLLAGCSGNGAGSAATTAPLVEATQAARPGAACDSAGFAQHAGLASGAVQTYLWQPMQAGAFKADAQARPQSLASGRQAAGLAVREWQAARPLVLGCPQSIQLANALDTATALAQAAKGQFDTGKVNTETLAGVNSINSTILGQAPRIGATVTVRTPTAAELTTPA